MPRGRLRRGPRIVVFPRAGWPGILVGVGWPVVGSLALSTRRAVVPPPTFAAARRHRSFAAVFVVRLAAAASPKLDPPSRASSATTSREYYTPNPAFGSTREWGVCAVFRVALDLTRRYVRANSDGRLPDCHPVPPPQTEWPLKTQRHPPPPNRCCGWPLRALPPERRHQTGQPPRSGRLPAQPTGISSARDGVAPRSGWNGCPPFDRWRCQLARKLVLGCAQEANETHD